MERYENKKTSVISNDDEPMFIQCGRPYEDFRLLTTR